MKKFFISAILIAVICACFYLNKPKQTQNKFTFWTIQLKPIYEKQINAIIEDFEKENNIRVVWVDIPISEAQKRTLASILSDTPPDLVNLNPDFSVLLAQRGALEYFDDNETSQYIPSLLDKLKFEGKIYALPFYATSPVTIYNKECISNISTYDELYEKAAEIKKCSSSAPFASNLNENDTLAKILNKYDIDSLNDDKQKQTAKKIFKMFDEMYKNEFLPKDVLNINHREMIEKYMSNQAAVIVAGSNFINMIKQNAPDVYAKSELTQQLTGSNRKYDVSLMNLIIPKKSKNKDLARKFAYTLTNTQNQLELSKLTNVLPANKYTIEDDFFKNCGTDLVEKSRCVAASQLNYLNCVSFGEKNKKTINEEINKTLEEVLLNNADIEKSINQLSKEIQKLQNN